MGSLVLGQLSVFQPVLADEGGLSQSLNDFYSNVRKSPDQSPEAMSRIKQPVIEKQNQELKDAKEKAKNDYKDYLRKQSLKANSIRASQATPQPSVPPVQDIKKSGKRGMSGPSLRVTNSKPQFKPVESVPVETTPIIDPSEIPAEIEFPQSSPTPSRLEPSPGLMKPSKKTR